jgi:hypothetical protein
MIAIYVDDFLTIRAEESIEEFINELKEHNFNLKVEDNLTDYSSCKIFQKRDKGKLWVMQPYLIDNLENKSGGGVSKMQSYINPGMHRFKIVRPTNKL